MFSEWRNDRRHRIGDRAAADHLTDRDNAAGIGDNSAEICDDAAGIVDIAANVIPGQTPSWMETGVTLFLEDKFQRGHQLISLVGLVCITWYHLPTTQQWCHQMSISYINVVNNQ